MTLSNSLAPPRRETFTNLLGRARLGDRLAAEMVYQIALPRLLSQARSLLARHRSHRTLDPADLVQEGFTRLGGWPVEFASSEHFFRLYCRVMSHILTDRGRRATVRNRAMELIEGMLVRDALIEDTNRGMMEDLLTHFGQVDPDAARAIRLHHCAGHTWDETARITGLSVAKVREHVAYGLDWMRHRL